MVVAAEATAEAEAATAAVWADSVEWAAWVRRRRRGCRRRGRARRRRRVVAWGRRDPARPTCKWIQAAVAAAGWIQDPGRTSGRTWIQACGRRWCWRGCRPHEVGARGCGRVAVTRQTRPDPTLLWMLTGGSCRAQPPIVVPLPSLAAPTATPRTCLLFLARFGLVRAGIYSPPPPHHLPSLPPLACCAIVPGCAFTS